MTNLGLALRQRARVPGFTATVVRTLALAVNAIVFLFGSEHFLRSMERS